MTLIKKRSEGHTKKIDNKKDAASKKIIKIHH